MYKTKMSEEKKNVTMICPYCKQSFVKRIRANFTNKSHLFTIFIKKHHNNKDCGAFIAFIDKQGMHRGSQKIDNMGNEPPINDDLFYQMNEEIKEMGNTLRFYHLKLQRKEGVGFEHKVANVEDRIFLSSRRYSTLISFLMDHKDQDAFGILACNNNALFEGGNLIYGKNCHMIYTIFLNDQEFLQQVSLDELKKYTKRIVNKLIDVYDLSDFFS